MGDVAAAPSRRADARPDSAGMARRGRQPMVEAIAARSGSDRWWIIWVAGGRFADLRSLDWMRRLRDRLPWACIDFASVLFSNCRSASTRTRRRGSETAVVGITCACWGCGALDRRILGRPGGRRRTDSTRRRAAGRRARLWDPAGVGLDASPLRGLTHRRSDWVDGSSTERPDYGRGPTTTTTDEGTASGCSL